MGERLDVKQIWPEVNSRADLARLRREYRCYRRQLIIEVCLWVGTAVVAMSIACWVFLEMRWTTIPRL